MFFTPLESNRSNKFKRADLIVSLFCLLILGACSTKEIVAEVNDEELKKTEAEMLMDHLGYDINNKT
jgi:hypothetical protein